MTRTVAVWLAIAGAALLAVPWYAVGDGFWSNFKILHFTSPQAAPALFQAALQPAPWLYAFVVPVLAGIAALLQPNNSTARSHLLIAAGVGGFFYLIVQAFFIDQPAISLGPVIAGMAFIVLFASGLGGRGVLRGDVFVIASITFVSVLVLLFIVYPISQIILTGFAYEAGSPPWSGFVDRAFTSRNWGLACVVGDRSCGVVWNSVFLGLLTGLSCTILGFAFALLVTRTRMPSRKLVRLLTILPIVTPPFVVGLALILLFGRSGTITGWMWELFSIPPSRWFYGLPGLWFAQTLAFTPMAFLVMVGVVQGLSPSMEEASRTLRASRWQCFTTITLPMARPGLANAFLLCFIESLADFGNPIVVGGGYQVLATEIFFAIAGAQYSPPRAGVLGILLLTFTLSAFWLQKYWVGRRSYTTMTGKGDAGRHQGLPTGVTLLVYAITIPWMLFTIGIYGIIMFGGFVEVWGFNHSLTLSHYAEMFSVIIADHGVVWSGGAWGSFFTTIWISMAAAPITAGIGLLTAFIIARQRFPGRGTFDFMTMLSFATPGTVIGVSYIMAFNVPPIEITGTAMILIVSFLSRNMPVGIRAGVAAMSQIDRSMDEASMTLGAGTLQTIKNILLPLLRPAIVAALVYSFVSSVTAVSAVVFLVSPDYSWATAYILGRIEGGHYGASIAYSSAIIVVLVIAIVIIQLGVGTARHERRRRGVAAPDPAAAGTSTVGAQV